MNIENELFKGVNALNIKWGLFCGITIEINGSKNNYHDF